MTDLDLERLGDMWRQQPDPAELERLQRSANAVRRRARLQQVTDLAAAILVGGVVLFLVISSGKTEAALVGSAAILVLLFSNLRQRRLREVELRSLSGTTEEMLDQSIERVEATLRFNRITILAIGPVIGLTLLFMAAADAGDIPALRHAISSDPRFGVLWFAVGIALLASVVVFLFLSIRRGQRELQRLVALRSSYGGEAEQRA
ncbi:MAG TPA: hypothetical protein VF704_10545 [Allosphingosinicella sp.]|jgi:hypothetical protein